MDFPTEKLTALAAEMRKTHVSGNLEFYSMNISDAAAKLETIITEMSKMRESITIAELEQLIADRWPGRTAWIMKTPSCVTLMIEQPDGNDGPEFYAASLEAIGKLLKEQAAIKFPEIKFNA